MTTSSMKVLANPEEYHYLGYGYDARTGQFIKVQLFNRKPDPDNMDETTGEPTAQVNRHPATTLYFEDHNSTETINNLLDINGEVDVTMNNLPLAVKGKLGFLSDTKKFYDSQYVKIFVDHIEKTE